MICELQIHHIDEVQGMLVLISVALFTNMD